MVVAEALQQATDASYAAVGTPVEGTILTVSRAASDAAVRAAGEPGARARDVFAVAAQAAREALARTPEQLPVLRRGRGRSTRAVADSAWCSDAAETVLTGRRPVPGHQPHRPPHDPGAARCRPRPEPRRAGRTR